MKTKTETVYARNHVFHSLLGTDRFFFAPKVRILDSGVAVVIGKKFDVTEDLQPYLLKRYRLKEKP